MSATVHLTHFPLEIHSGWGKVASQYDFHFADGSGYWMIFYVYSHNVKKRLFRGRIKPSGRLFRGRNKQSRSGGRAGNRVIMTEV